MGILVWKAQLKVDLIPDSSQRQRYKRRLDVQVRQTRNITVGTSHESSVALLRGILW